MIRIRWVFVLLAIVLAAGAGWCYGRRKPESPEIEKRAKAIVEDSLPAWKSQDVRDSVAIDSLTQLAAEQRSLAQKGKEERDRIRRERDSLRTLTAASQRVADSLYSDPPPAAEDWSNPGIRFWRDVATQQMRLAANYRLEADLAREADASTDGIITRLENAAAEDQKKMKRLQDRVDRVTIERDKAVATLDTLRRERDCSGPLGIPCPEIGVGLGVNYGAVPTIPPRAQVTLGATIGVYFPVKKIRI